MERLLVADHSVEDGEELSHASGESYFLQFASFQQMLELHKRSPRTPQEQEMVKREIESMDRQIDRLVYELYGLTEDEVKVVEA